LLNLEILKKIDTKGMFKIYDDWPQIALESFSNSLESIKCNKVEHIVFAGMGGSGTVGDVFSSILSKTDIHVSVVKGYTLPKTVNQESLVISTSVSGDTDETMNIVKLTKEIGCNSIAFSSGGKIENYCLKNNLEYRKIEQIHSPRASFTKFLFSMLKVLSPIIPISDNMVKESIQVINQLKNKIDSTNITEDNPALNLAEWIKETPVIYYPVGFEAAVIRFKNSLQENSKQHVIAEDIIETCHNGIVSWEKPSKFNPILVQGEDDYVKTKERWNILKEYFNENNLEFKEIHSVKGNILSKIIQLIYLFDYASIYNAVINEIDPTPVKSIEYIKKRL